MEVHIEPDAVAMGRAAAKLAAIRINHAIRTRGWCRIIVATGASQFEVLRHLVEAHEINWSRVEVFHLDEYVGLPADHPASFRGYLRKRLADRVPLAAFHELDGETDPQATCDRVGRLIRGGGIDVPPVDVALVGIGENGHLAFNDPPADFRTREAYHVVPLDEACRRQQVGEGWFGSLDEVPTHAISMTVRQIMEARTIICSVPDERKADAVAATLGPISPRVPATALRLHRSVELFLDEAAASKLDRSLLFEHGGNVERLSPMADLQVNGYAGVDFNADDLTPEQFEAAAAAIAADEVDCFLPTLITDSPKAMRARCRRLVAAIDQTGRGRLAPGLHLEGPFISGEPGYVGAHPAEHVRPADRELMASLIDAADGRIRLVTLAPEQDPDGALTKWLWDQDISVFAGHTNASSEQLEIGYQAGLTGFTHLGNACPQSMPRHDNIILRILARVSKLELGYVSLIADGVHIPADVFPAFGGSIIVSDATAATGLGPGRYELAGQSVEIGEDGIPWSADRTHFVGSATPLSIMRRNVLGWLGTTNAHTLQTMLENPLDVMGFGDAMAFYAEAADS